MSKHGIAGRFFMTSEEIDHFEIDSLKLRHMKTSLGSIKDSFIIFVLLIPDFVEEEYKTEIVVPIPNRNFTQLDIQTTRTVTVQDVTYIVEDENILYKMKVVDTCISNILRNNYKNCNKIKMKEKSIEEIEIGNLLLTNIESILYDSCTNFSYPLKGNYFVNIENCEIEIDNFKIKRFESKLNVIVPNFNVLPVNMTELLPELNFTNINVIEETLKKQQNNYNFYILYTLIFVSILFYIFIKIKKYMFIRRDSNLNDGGVIYADQPANPIINFPLSIPV